MLRTPEIQMNIPSRHLTTVHCLHTSFQNFSNNSKAANTSPSLSDWLALESWRCWIVLHIFCGVDQWFRVERKACWRGLARSTLRWLVRQRASGVLSCEWSLWNFQPGGDVRLSLLPMQTWYTTRLMKPWDSGPFWKRISKAAPWKWASLLYWCWCVQRHQFGDDGIGELEFEKCGWVVRDNVGPPQGTRAMSGYKNATSKEVDGWEGYQVVGFAVIYSNEPGKPLQNFCTPTITSLSRQSLGIVSVEIARHQQSR